MKTYWPVRPVKVSMSRAISSGVKRRNCATTSKLRPRERAVGLGAHVADQGLDAGGKRHRGLAAVE